MSAVVLISLIGLGIGELSGGDDFLAIAWERTIGGEGVAIPHSFERTADGGLFLGESLPPAPHPLCGRDPSADGLEVCRHDTLSCP